jgi:hypothetical protein
MRKGKILRSVLLCLSLFLLMFIVVSPGIMADSPKEAEPVYPTKIPPPNPPAELEEDQLIPSEPDRDEKVYEAGVRGGITSWMLYNAETPYKSGSDVIARAWTESNPILLVWKHVMADTYLWKWVGDHWVLVAEYHRVIICPPGCYISSTATYSNAQSAYYITTSVHEVWADNKPLHYATDQSNYVWLDF